MQDLLYGLMPVHFFTSSETDKSISSWEIEKKKSLLSTLLPIFALLPAVISVYSLSKQKLYIYKYSSLLCLLV